MSRLRLALQFVLRSLPRTTLMQLARIIGTVTATVKHRSLAPPRPFVVAYADCQGDVGARCAGIVRAVRGAQQLPASGLADVVGALASHAARDGARGVLLTGRPHAATTLANRSKSLRAVTARDPATLLAAASECAANLLVINPRELSAFHCERLAQELSIAIWGNPPPELSAAPAPCACSSHPH